MSKARILVVEDEKIVARDIQARLTGMGYTVTAIASTAEAAIRDAEKSKPDLVLMDIVLKGDQDGIDAASQISEKFDLPVVYLTAYTDEKTLSRAKITEPFGYVVKPFEDRELQINIEMALRKHTSQKALRESEERFRTLAENSFEGIVINYSEKILDCNEPYAMMLGLTRDEVLARKASSFLTKASLEKMRALGADSLGKPIELEALRKDGSVIPVETQTRLIRYHGADVHYTSMRDLTARKQVEALKRERARSELYGFVVSALPVIMPGPIEEVREDLVKMFADRFERSFKPRFEEELRKEKGPDPKADPVEVFVRWVGDMFINLGIDATSCMKDGSGSMELLSCPWLEYSRTNPVFCLLCRAMAFRGFVWVSPNGAVGLRSTIAGGGKTCHFTFKPAPQRGR